MKATRTREPVMTDRERILVNIAATLACELATCQGFPAVQEYMRRNPPRALAEYGNRDYRKGDLVVCHTSTGRQENPWLISFVEEVGLPSEPAGLVLRAIGSQATCDYGNETFIKISGMARWLLFEGDRKSLYVKTLAAFRRLDHMWHMFRGLEFDAVRDDLAYVIVGERCGGIPKPTKPYRIEIVFRKRTTIKAIVAQMEAQGFGTRAFEPVDEVESAGRTA